jgi:hypothetical protein
MPAVVMANGGAFAPSGRAMVAVAAKDYSVLIVCHDTSPRMTHLFPHNNAAAKASRVSPAVWRHSCNNYIGLAVVVAAIPLIGSTSRNKTVLCGSI